MGDVVRLLDAVRRLQATGSLRAANGYLDRAERTADARAHRRDVERARRALVSIENAGKLVFRPEQRIWLDAARDRARRRLEAIEGRRQSTNEAAARPTCVLLEWPGGMNSTKRSD